MTRPPTIEVTETEGTRIIRVHPWDGAERVGRSFSVLGGMGSLIGVFGLIATAVVAWQTRVSPGWVAPALQTLLGVSLVALFVGRSQQRDIWQLRLSDDEVALPDATVPLTAIDEVVVDPWSVSLRCGEEAHVLPTGRVRENAAWLGQVLTDAVARSRPSQ